MGGEAREGPGGEQVVQALGATVGEMLWEKRGAPGRDEQRSPAFKGTDPGCSVAASKHLLWA